LNTHRYCGVCAGSNTANTYEMALHCQNCGYRVYPTISPCVIAVIYKGDEILLAQAARTVTGAYGCISGYVSPGENLETALKREVMEEVGLQITNIQYITSQHWPFPNSILMGFTAEYLSGEIMVDKKEIADAKWFHRKDVDNLPVLPDPLSIARHLINLFIS
jgi:NAD+ diphosphatase